MAAGIYESGLGRTALTLSDGLKLPRHEISDVAPLHNVWGVATSRRMRHKPPRIDGKADGTSP